MGLLVGGILASAACGTTEEALPPDVKDPASIQTPAGALGYYRGVLQVNLPSSVDVAAISGGLFVDETTLLPVVPGTNSLYLVLDRRIGVNGSGGADEYVSFHKLRTQAREARGFLSAYLPDTLPALRGHLYAVEGYAEIYLADLFCSGIPLSTVDFNADFTFAAGSSTTEVYTHAAALFDSAFKLTSDSLQLQHLAAVGRARALLALGQYSDAAAAVGAVPDNFKYQVIALTSSQGGVLSGQFANVGNVGAAGAALMTMANQEGMNGINYRSSGDPRAAFTLRGTSGSNNAYAPSKYLPLSTAKFTVADGIEARLIEAEAALQANADDGLWLTKLNALRTDGTFDTVPKAGSPGQNDTLWHAGGGGVANLRPLDDPGSTPARVDLLFRERAFWLYLTGHRHADLRRLVRQYGRARETVFPTGAYSSAFSGVYDSDVVMSVPDDEQLYNPMYTGCIHHSE